MEVFIEHLLNSAIIPKIKTSKSLRQTTENLYQFSYSRFGGWEISYNGKGRTRLIKETMGGINFG